MRPTLSPSSMLMLLLSTLFAASSSLAAPIVQAGTLLTAESWSNTANGTWLIEHYSPYCPHCRSFAPKWAELVHLREKDAGARNFHFAQVDCAANGDLCQLNGVKFYPSIFLYVDGVQTDEYPGKRTVEDLSTYIDGHLPVEVGEGKSGIDDGPQHVEVSDEKEVVMTPEGKAAEVDKLFSGGPESTVFKKLPKPKDVKLHLEQDSDETDTVSSSSNVVLDKEAAPSASKKTSGVPVHGDEPVKDLDGEVKVKDEDDNDVVEGRPRLSGSFITQVRQQVEEKRRDLPRPDGEVHVLDPTHVHGLRGDDAPPAFVKYYAPWCGHCKALTPRWIDLAIALMGQVHVYEMDCDQASTKKVCAKEKVQGYPTLMFYNQGTAIEYHGKRDVESMRAFAVKTIAATTIKPLANEYELKRAVATDPVVVLFLHSTSIAKDDLDVAVAAAKSLQASAPFYTSTSPDLFSLFSIEQESVLLVFKDQRLQPSASFNLPSSSLGQTTRVRTVSNWLRSAKLPVLVELTGATIADILPSTGEPPLVVLGIFSKRMMSDSFEEKKKGFEAIARGWFVRNGKKEAGERGRDVIWTWVEADRWAGWIKSLYAVNWGNEPGIVVADPKELVYWNRNLAGTPISASADEIYETIERGIYTEVIKPLTSRSFFEQIGHHMSKLPGLSFAGSLSEHPTVLVVAVVLSWLVLWCVVKAILRPSSKSGRSVAPPRGLATKYE